MRLAAAALAWESRAVVARHLRIHLRNWHTSFLPPAVEPVTMLFAFGVGLGGYVVSLSWHGRDIGYLTYVAPGLLAYTTFMTAMFQALFGAFIRMRYQRTWEGQLTTQVELRHVVWGEILWAGLLATMYVVIVAMVLTAFRLAGLVDLDVRLIPVLLPIAFVCACAFAALALLFTATLPTIDHMNLPVFLLILPMGVLSATYFPLEHPTLIAVSWVNPLYHLAESFRALLLGQFPAAHLGSLAVLVTLMLVVLVPLDLRLVRRRILGD